MPETDLQYKRISLKSFTGLQEGSGWLKGYASVYREIDDGGDLILLGACADVLDEFLKKGFTAHSHDWTVNGGIIGYPMIAKEDETGLYVESKFHSTVDAQLVRTKALERMEDGKEVQLSIGYRTAGAFFILPADYETELPKYINPTRLKENLEKAKSFAKIRVIPKMATLVEYSIVPWAMNQLANATDVKSGNPLQEQTMTIPAATENSVIPALTKEQTDALPANCFALAGARLFAFRDAAGVLLKTDIAAAIESIPASTLTAVEKFKAGAILHRIAKKAGLDVIGLKAEEGKTLADPFFSVKGFFEQVIAENILSAYECISYLYDALNAIDNYADAAELIGENVNTDALVEETVAEFAARILVWAKDYISEDFDPYGYGYYGYMGQSSTLSNTAALTALDAALRGIVPFNVHSEAVQATSEEFAKQAGLQVKLLTGLAERRIKIIQLKEGKEYSAKNKERIKSHIDSLTKTRDSVDTVIAGMKAMIEPEDDCEDEEDKTAGKTGNPADPTPIPATESKADNSLVQELMLRQMQLDIKLLPTA